MLHSEVSTGYEIGIWAGIAFAIIFVVVGAIVGAVLNSNYQYATRKGLLNWGLLWGPAVGAIWTIIYSAIFLWAAYPPLNSAYHTYVPTTIQVATTSSRFLGDGNGGTNQFFAIQDKTGNTYRCDDTRCSVLKPGQFVTLMCVKEFETNGVPGEDCNFGKYGKNVQQLSAR